MTLISHDSYGFPVMFECENVNSTATPTPVTLNFYYDLAWNTNNMTEDMSRAYVEGSLLQQLAAYYGFWGGHACNGKLNNRAWFVNLTSLPEDVPNASNATCREVVPSGDENCTLYQATMKGNVIGASDLWETIGLAALQINSGAVVGTVRSIRVKFVDADDTLDYTYDETGRDVLTPPVNSVVQATAPSNNVTADDSFTVIGIAMVAGLTMAVLGVVLVIVRKSRRRKRQSATAAATTRTVSRRDNESNHSDTQQQQPTTLVLPPPDVNALHDDMEQDSQSPSDEDSFFERTADEGGREYNFDLGGWMKSELVGIHGGTAVTAEPPPPPRYATEEGLYDSDNDSWAQTEATIGSLELRLDPIEAEV